MRTQPSIKRAMFIAALIAASFTGCESALEGEIKQSVEQHADNHATQIAAKQVGPIARTLTESAARTIESNATKSLHEIVGTWQEVNEKNFDTFNANGTYLGKIEEEITTDLDTTGFVGNITVYLAGSATGTWKRQGDHLTVEVLNTDGLVIKDVSLERTKPTPGFDLDLEKLRRKLLGHFRESLPSEMRRSMTLTILRVSADTLVTKDEEGEVTVGKRVR